MDVVGPGLGPMGPPDLLPELSLGCPGDPELSLGRPGDPERGLGHPGSLLSRLQQECLSGDSEVQSRLLKTRTGRPLTRQPATAIRVSLASALPFSEPRLNPNRPLTGARPRSAYMAGARASAAQRHHPAHLQATA